MTNLDNLIMAAFKSEGAQADVNKVYLALLKAQLFLPTQKDKTLSDEPFVPLHTKIDDNYFMLAFSTLEKLKSWAGDHEESIRYVELSGKDVFSGINENVYLVLNVDTPTCKEFSPDEVKQLKKIIARIENL